MFPAFYGMVWGAFHHRSIHPAYGFKFKGCKFSSSSMRVQRYLWSAKGSATSLVKKGSSNIFSQQGVQQYLWSTRGSVISLISKGFSNIFGQQGVQ